MTIKCVEGATMVELALLVRNVLRLQNVVSMCPNPSETGDDPSQ